MSFFQFIRFSYRLIRFIRRRIRRSAGGLLTKLLFFVNHVTVGSGLESYGVPVVDINDGCSMVAGASLMLNSGMNHNRIGRQQPCFFIADLGGTIRIGDRVGMSSTALVCHRAITIGNDVTIGGNTVIYDTDFHSLDTARRRAGFTDNALAVAEPVVIGNNVFIGAHVTILKGVTVGGNSVIGAGSVVTKSIPANQIWGGNPARFIRLLYPEIA